MLLSLLITADTTVANLWPPSGDDLKTGATILTLLFGGGILTKMVSIVRERRRQKLAMKRVPVGDFLPSAVSSALRYYVEHEVSAIDPAGRELDRANLGPRELLFRLLDRTLYDTDDRQHLLLLADSGMGKTTALLNYYAHNAKRKNSHPVTIFSLRAKGIEAKIEAVQDKSNTVLLLDALDEDPAAVANHTARIHNLLSLGQDFRAIVISCRSQFFLATEEITKETGIAKISHRGLGEPAEYLLMKCYLCPFSEAQVRTFLRKRYPSPQWGRRARARKVVDRVHDLSARPMLLAYIDDLTRSGKFISNIADAYDAIVEQWILRERPMVKDSAALLEFSQKLAVDLYLKREARGGEHARASEIFGLAHEWGISLERWHLTGRSLLTRDAANQFRFAHRSILEYLFVTAFLEGEIKCATVSWTDQMYSFLRDLLGIATREQPSEPLVSAVRSLARAARNSASIDRDLARGLTSSLLNEFIRSAARHFAKLDNSDASKVRFGSHISDHPLRPSLELCASAFLSCNTVARVPEVLILGFVRNEQNRAMIVSSTSAPEHNADRHAARVQELLQSRATSIVTATSFIGATDITIVMPVPAAKLTHGLLIVVRYDIVLTNDEVSSILSDLDKLTSYPRMW